MLAGQALAAKSNDALRQRLIRLLGNAMRSRRAIKHGLTSAGLETFDPAGNDLGRDTIGMGRLCFGRATLNEGESHFFSTQRRQSASL